ncbi:GNAT family N-acetyltransferase [Virgibacillus sp. 179-BFC.A HS]|uniref:GNAT family N-acetyltransferase n=1 Tax=Tigheibacillus jepli TaxID=3035914 RepID=A0ABU5CEL4_9BACI|nr:GNAT family N-acetyltransferase [Virgibacillus sp. 179-BFC.A HS]MDY0404777.1 GNAT family N-acetyltransferase [Virgibacillus sp. 179-BFC.A HS]
MEKIPLAMVHELKDIPQFPLPEGYYFRFFSRNNDEKTWARIVTATDEFPNEQAALRRFENEFAPYLREAEKRIIFLDTADGQTVGTATAWYGKWNDKKIGRLHWVEIIPAYQGKKLGRPLIAEAMNHLKLYHDAAYLTTQTTSPAAIHIYKAFDWQPYIRTDIERSAWKTVNYPPLIDHSV